MLKKKTKTRNHLHVADLDLLKFILCHCGHFYRGLDLFSITLLFTEFTEFINKLVFYIQGFSIAQQDRKEVLGSGTRV